MLAPRFTAAALGLLAFSVSVLGGLWARNPVEVILSRSIWAMLIFCVIGLVTGWAAQRVVREHLDKCELESMPVEEDDAIDGDEEASEQNTSIREEPSPMGT